LLEAHSILAKDFGETSGATRRCAQALWDLYIEWNKAQSGKGLDAKAAQWKAKLEPAKE